MTRNDHRHCESVWTDGVVRGRAIPERHKLIYEYCGQQLDELILEMRWENEHLKRKIGYPVKLSLDFTAESTMAMAARA